MTYCLCLWLSWTLFIRFSFDVLHITPEHLKKILRGPGQISGRGKYYRSHVFGQNPFFLTSFVMVTQEFTQSPGLDLLQVGFMKYDFTSVLGQNPLLVT